MIQRTDVHAQLRETVLVVPAVTVPPQVLTAAVVQVAAPKPTVGAHQLTPVGAVVHPTQKLVVTVPDVCCVTVPSVKVDLAPIQSHT